MSHWLAFTSLSVSGSPTAWSFWTPLGCISFSRPCSAQMVLYAMLAPWLWCSMPASILHPVVMCWIISWEQPASGKPGSLMILILCLKYLDLLPRTCSCAAVICMKRLVSLSSHWYDLLCHPFFSTCWLSCRILSFHNGSFFMCLFFCWFLKPEVSLSTRSVVTNFLM